ncbi:hypothetical protein B1H19_05300 [Streptomyces gilvosporeus]|uniref:Uncharacterized protein n=1 Tax=Streptomyces gilvosporeus TaxID=553510 RepID=A0A1V0TL65_9ACTN|nr:hypothetical protein B1H19_05300 [Streptomyces gilvosporeus]
MASAGLTEMIKHGVHDIALSSPKNPACPGNRATLLTQHRPYPASTPEEFPEPTTKSEYETVRIPSAEPEVDQPFAGWRESLGLAQLLFHFIPFHAGPDLVAADAGGTAASIRQLVRSAGVRA